jgi:prevent-host-death family protein
MELGPKTDMCTVWTQSATVGHMPREISVRELRNQTAEVVAAVRSGERLSLTVNRMPVADIVPHTQERSPWIRSATLRSIVGQAMTDPDLLSDLADVRGALVEVS